MKFPFEKVVYHCCTFYGFPKHFDYIFIMYSEYTIYTLHTEYATYVFPIYIVYTLHIQIVSYTLINIKSVYKINVLYVHCTL